MSEAVIVEALRSPIARGKMGKGGLSGIHPARLLGTLQQAVVDRVELVAPYNTILKRIFGWYISLFHRLNTTIRNKSN